MRTFRPATQADLPSIMRIIAQAQAYLAAQGIDQWQDGYPDEDVMRTDIRGGHGYVLTEDGRVIGLAAIVVGDEPSYAEIHDGAWTTQPQYACIHRVALDMERRGSGAANDLMKSAEDVIREHGITSVRIDTHRDNCVMQGMLARNGYTPCGVIYLCDGNERGAERIALEKTLA